MNIYRLTMLVAVVPFKNLHFQYYFVLQIVSRTSFLYAALSVSNLKDWSTKDQSTLDNYKCTL